MTIVFLAGMMVGAVLGVLVTCLLIVTSDTDDWEDAW